MTTVQPTPVRAERASCILDAICCHCGTTRQCRRPRNRVHRDLDTWERELGDLKCESCGTITRHAIVTGIDADEIFEARCRGRLRWPNGFDGEPCMKQYRSGPQNPRLTHTYSKKDAEAARAHGVYRVRAWCGAMEDIPRFDGQAVSLSNTEQVAPVVAADDLSTFLTSWVRGDCVDCEYVHNYWVRDRQRQRLRVLMTAALGELLDRHCVGDYDEHLPELIAALERVHGEGGGRQ